MSDTRVDLYLEWEQALNEPEVDSTVVAGLETKARDMGIDLWQINNIMLNGLTAASFGQVDQARRAESRQSQCRSHARRWKQCCSQAEPSGFWPCNESSSQQPGNTGI
jgi:hypothetical protein